MFLFDLAAFRSGRRVHFSLVWTDFLSRLTRFERGADEEGASLNEVIQRPLERRLGIPQHPDPFVARHTEMASEEPCLVAVVDDDSPRVAAALARLWARCRERRREECVLPSAGGAAYPAFSPAVGFCRGGAGDVKDAVFSAAPAEHVIFNLDDGTFGRPAAADD